ncbi:glutamyl-tRNA reductase [Aureibacter tunicatorum]|uniref:Glutamyl-tRNA reductase n=1 Tax=Aureibacter tunicatorum TaxID=866807 RepID=A0AAE4BRJ2_9BACT|nr:glutamyl-tRNA reductase [Aureibacter tunicatorum]MDR6237282.1 glutamyl-tRNA reductase [Aureibacter tunicatorum]BDD06273.1 glutamyl-tRNA reductase [Aureibacter tunicatorum]
MYNNFKTTSLSYKHAPIEVRELVALDETACKSLLRMIKEHTDISEVLILSTCNRTEFYYCADEDRTVELVKLLCIHKGYSDSSSILPFFHCIDDNYEAQKYFFRVSMGLEAKVIGDIQISNQIKRAYQWCADEECVGPFLHRLLHTIFYSNKRVSQETAFRDGGASVAYVAAEMAEDFASQIITPKILVLGVGEIGTDVCKNLETVPEGTEVYIMNRTRSKAEALAEECGHQVMDFSRMKEAVQECDVIICSIAADSPFITKNMVESLNIPGYKMFIDLSVPRSIELGVETVPGVVLQNIDTISEKTNKAVQKRIASIPDVERIIEETLDEFGDWSKEMTVSPTIKKMKDALEQIRKEEMARYLKKASDKEAKMIDQVTKSMIQKIMKLPVLQLKAACKRDEAETLIDVLNDLFDLEKAAEKTPRQ